MTNHWFSTTQAIEKLLDKKLIFVGKLRANKNKTSLLFGDTKICEKKNKKTALLASNNMFTQIRRKKPYYYQKHITQYTERFKILM